MNINDSIKSLISFINKPFPEAINIATYIRTMIVIALFVTLFLGLIRPFNMDQNEGMVWSYSIIYGVITFVAGMSYELILRYIFKINKEGKSYTFFKWLTQVIGLLLFIALFNYLYSAYEFGMTWKVLPYMIWATFLIGVFPTVFIGTISMIKSEKKNSEIAATLNKELIKPNPIVHQSTLFNIPTEHIWFIESLQNYVNIFYWNTESIEMKTERATLKSCEDLTKNTNLLRCHRSYIVNTSKIENVSGNAQGLKLKLSDHELLIPVSRSYISLFKA